MKRAIGAGVLIGTLVCAVQPAVARRGAAPMGVAAARLGLINGRSQRMGPRLVKRGGYTAITAMVRPRFVGGMIDIYPAARSGFRLSTGTRYFVRTNNWQAAEQATRGLLYDPHMTRGGIGLVRPFRRYIPALTLGYDLQPAPGLVVGPEGGTMMGGAIVTGPRGTRLSGSDDSKMERSGLNPVATVAVRYAF